MTLTAMGIWGSLIALGLGFVMGAPPPCGTRRAVMADFCLWLGISPLEWRWAVISERPGWILRVGPFHIAFAIKRDSDD